MLRNRNDECTFALASFSALEIRFDNLLSKCSTLRSSTATRSNTQPPRSSDRRFILVKEPNEYPNRRFGSVTMGTTFAQFSSVRLPCKAIVLSHFPLRSLLSTDFELKKTKA